MSRDPWVNVLEGPYLREWEERQRAPVQAVPTGLPSLNRACGDDGGRIGLALSWFVTIGGNPGHGKSILALFLAWEALKAGQSVAFLTLEMSHYALATRLYAIATGTPVRNLERGPAFAPGELGRKVKDLWVENSCADLHVNRDPLHSIAQVQEYLDGAAQTGVKVAFVDYLQLIGTGNEDSIYAQVAEIATTLRAFAHSRGVLVVGLSQYNRRTSADRTQKPMAQSLHGGMSLEANSDVVVLLDHSRYERDVTHPNIARTFAIIGKNRHGPQCDIPIEWDYHTLRTREADPDEEHLWPGQRRDR